MSLPDLASLPWSLAAAARVALYRRGWRRTVGLGHPTVSVGALEMGGSGKTPATAAVAEAVAGLGLRPGILSRGYGRTSSGAVLVSRGDGNGPIVEASEGGDEPWLLAHLQPSIPVAVAAKREKAAALISDLVDVFVLDDAFQHVRVARDVDLLVVDAGTPFWLAYPPPFGRLREGRSAANRADGLLLPRDIEAIPEPLRRKPVVRLEPCLGRTLPLPAWVENPNAGQPESAPTEVYGFAGIAHPDRFAAGLRCHGLTVRGFRAFRDHEPLRARDLRSLTQAADGAALITTEKDAARIARFAEDFSNIHVRTYRFRIGAPAVLSDLLGAAGEAAS